VEGQPFPLTAHFFLLLFTVLVSIILMNLLVGLAVSDIQGLSKSAKLDQLIQQVNVYCLGVLMNLLVSLAVSDIQGLSKSTKLDQLIQQVSLFTVLVLTIRASPNLPNLIR
jgi:hypothetical protein